MTAIAFAPSRMGRLKELTSQLLLEEDFVMSFFQVCPDMLCILDHNKCIAHLNDAWEKILGFTSEELVLQPLTSFIIPQDVAATASIINSLKTSQVVRFYNNSKTKMGDIVPLEWNMVLSTDGYIYAVARNIPHECVECERARQKLCLPSE